MAPKKWAAQLAAARAVKEADKRKVAASTQQTELATDTGEAHATAASQPMPHMGWNDVHPAAGSRLFSAGFDEAAQFYFLHSFYFDAQDKSDVAATAHYGLDFDAVVSRGRIHGVQCHPEKSHHWGTQLLKNFAEL
jgi:glutamine amidotransferase